MGGVNRRTVGCKTLTLGQRELIEIYYCFYVCCIFHDETITSSLSSWVSCPLVLQETECWLALREVPLGLPSYGGQGLDLAEAGNSTLTV